MEHISKFLSLERVARMMNTCPVCGRDKISGETMPVVCWGKCWRNTDWGLKYTTLDTETWLNKYAKK